MKRNGWEGALLPDSSSAWLRACSTNENVGFFILLIYSFAKHGTERTLCWTINKRKPTSCRVAWLEIIRPGFLCLLVAEVPIVCQWFILS
jgi:hypothetical protein